LIPGPRVISCMPIFEHDDFPDLINCQVLLPWRHHRGPRKTFTRQTDSAFGYPPKYKSLLQLSDGSGIREVCRNRVKGKCPQTTAVQIIPVTKVAILKKYFPT